MVTAILSDVGAADWDFEPLGIDRFGESLGSMVIGGRRDPKDTKERRGSKSSRQKHTQRTQTKGNVESGNNWAETGGKHGKNV